MFGYIAIASFCACIYGVCCKLEAEVREETRKEWEKEDERLAA